MPAVVNRLLGGKSAACVRSVATGGETTPQMISQGPSQVDVWYDARFDHNIAVIWSGTNDWTMGGNAAQTYTDIETWCLARRAAGFDVIVFTLHPEGNVNYMTFRADFNAALLTDHDFCDAIADTTGEALLVPTDLTYYLSDHVHLTAAGNELVSPYVVTAIQTLLI